jgi:NAD(P)-dependent dehydrogenase (short-subunit alcohol dehydrogenase family)
MTLQGKNAVVTGSTSGIGHGIALALARAGCNIVVNGLGSEADNRKAIDEVKSVGVRVAFDPANMLRHNQIADMIAKAEKDFGSVDVLVNNAGIQRVGLAGQLSYEDWQAVIGTHLTGTFLCCSEAIPRMTAGGRGGAIVSIASVAGFVGLPGRGPYSAAKAGIMGLTRVLAIEGTAAGIRVNAVAPGFTRTELIQQALDDGSLTEEWMLRNVPLDRIAEPDEIARVVCFLASDDASYVTGQTLVVDGGWTIQGISAAPEWLTAEGAH